jgi:hypothetical protein
MRTWPHECAWDFGAEPSYSARVTYGPNGTILSWGDVRLDTTTTPRNKNMKYGIISTRVRRWLGLERLESNMLTLDGMVSGAASKANLLTDEINLNRQRVNETMRVAKGTDNRQTSLRREVENLGIMARHTSDAVGTVWRTADGYTAPIKMLSDSHLENIMAGDFGSYEVREEILREQRRRTEDDSWAKRSDTLSTRDRITALEVLATTPQDSPRGRDLARVIYRRQPACRISNARTMRGGLTPVRPERTARKSPAAPVLGELPSSGEPETNSFAYYGENPDMPYLTMRERLANETRGDNHQPRSLNSRRGRTVQNVTMDVDFAALESRALLDIIKRTPLMRQLLINALNGSGK